MRLIGFCESPPFIVTPLYAGDLYNYLHAEGSFASSLPKNYPIEMDLKMNLISEFVEAMTGIPFFPGVEEEKVERTSNLSNK